MNQPTIASGAATTPLPATAPAPDKRVQPLRRPHTAAAAGDPIPFTHDGQLHLFYLSSPKGDLDYPGRVRTTWQHAVSSDLQQWTELVPAVEPGEKDSYDGGGAWTGSIVEHDGVFYLFYTGHHVGVQHPQTICLATSTDLVNFTKYQVNPILLPVPGYEAVDWRDPYVFWNETESCWWMLIAARRQRGHYWRRGCIALATSSDLLHWEVEDEPLYDPKTTFCPECPELWVDQDGRWHLVYSRFSEQVGTVSRIANSPRGPFREPSRPDLGGRRWYAAKSAPWRGERVFFGWIHDRTIQGGHDRWLWGGDFALPRLARATQDGSLAMRPACLQSFVTAGEAEITGEIAAQGTALLGSGGSASVTWASPHQGRLDQMLVFNGAAVARAVGCFLRVDDEHAGWRIEVTPITGTVHLRREPTALDDFWTDLTGRSAQHREVDGEVVAAARIISKTTDVHMRVVLDGPLLEVYVNDEAALSHRLSGAPVVELFAEVVDGDVDVRTGA